MQSDADRRHCCGGCTEDHQCKAEADRWQSHSPNTDISSSIRCYRHSSSDGKPATIKTSGSGSNSWTLIIFTQQLPPRSSAFLNILLFFHIPSVTGCERVHVLIIIIIIRLHGTSARWCRRPVSPEFSTPPYPLPVQLMNECPCCTIDW